MSVLILYTLPPEVSPPDRILGEFDLHEAAQGVAEVLPGATTLGIQGEIGEMLAILTAHRPDVVFNLCEAPVGRPDREGHVAALFEWLGVRFTGSGSETLALCRRKDRVDAVLAAAGVPVPRRGVFPCIVKPADEDGSVGIWPDSVCGDRQALAHARARLAEPAVVQEFLPGREFAVALWGGDDPEYISIGETLFVRGLQVITYAAKWDTESADFANTPLSYDTVLDPPLRQAVIAAARGAWRAVGARGYLRVDVRLDAAGTPFVLDVNPNPELSPGKGMHWAVTAAGWTWERFVTQQVAWAR